MITFLLCFIQFLYYVFTKEFLFVGMDSFGIVVVSIFVGFIEFVPELILLRGVLERIVEGEQQ